MSDKPIYTREEKIKYFSIEIFKTEKKLERLKARLAYLTSDNYQDWNTQLEKRINELKKGEGS